MWCCCRKKCLDSMLSQRSTYERSSLSCLRCLKQRGITSSLGKFQEIDDVGLQFGNSTEASSTQDFGIFETLPW